MSVTLLNTSTNVSTILHADGSGAQLSPGAYKVTRYTARPGQSQLQGWFTVRTTLDGRETVTQVDQVPLSSIAPFNIRNPNFLVVAALPPVGAFPTVVLQ